MTIVVSENAPSFTQVRKSGDIAATKFCAVIAVVYVRNIEVATQSVTTIAFTCVTKIARVNGL